MKQTIVARYEYPMNRYSLLEVVEEYDSIFKPLYDERGVKVGGVSAAHALDTNTIILLVYSSEVDSFLQLKFSGRKNVKVNRYIIEE